MLINNSLLECLIEFDLQLCVAQPDISLRAIPIAYPYGEASYAQRLQELRKACGMASLRDATRTLRASLLPTALWASYGRR